MECSVDAYGLISSGFAWLKTYEFARLSPNAIAGVTLAALSRSLMWLNRFSASKQHLLNSHCSSPGLGEKICKLMNRTRLVLHCSYGFHARTDEYRAAQPMPKQKRAHFSQSPHRNISIRQ